MAITSAKYVAITSATLTITSVNIIIKNNIYGLTSAIICKKNKFSLTQIKSKGIHLPIHHLVLNSIEQHFPQTWKKPRWILAKACLTAKNIVLFRRNL